MEVRLGCAEALGKLGDVLAIPALLNVLGDTSLLVATAACKAIRLIKALQRTKHLQSLAAEASTSGDKGRQVAAAREIADTLGDLAIDMGATRTWLNVDVPTGDEGYSKGFLISRHSGDWAWKIDIVRPGEDNYVMRIDLSRHHPCWILDLVSDKHFVYWVVLAMFDVGERFGDFECVDYSNFPRERVLNAAAEADEEWDET